MSQPMTQCPFCGARAYDESIDTMESIDGTFLVAKWRCAEDPTHWWSDRTDALFPARGNDHLPRSGKVPGRPSDWRSGDRAA